MLSTPMLIATTMRSLGVAAQPSLSLPAKPAAVAITARTNSRRVIDNSRLINTDLLVSMPAEKIEYRRMTFFRHLPQITVPSACHENQLGVGNLLRQHLGRFNVTAGAALMDVLAADNNQCWRFDFMEQVGRFMALPRHHVAQVAL